MSTPTDLTRALSTLYHLVAAEGDELHREALDNVMFEVARLRAASRLFATGDTIGWEDLRYLPVGSVVVDLNDPDESAVSLKTGDNQWVWAAYDEPLEPGNDKDHLGCNLKVLFVSGHSVADTSTNSPA